MAVTNAARRADERYIGQIDMCFGNRCPVPVRALQWCIPRPRNATPGMRTGPREGPWSSPRHGQASRALECAAGFTRAVDADRHQTSQNLERGIKTGVSEERPMQNDKPVCSRCGSPDFLQPHAALCSDCARWLNKLSPEGKAADRIHWAYPERAPKL